MFFDEDREPPVYVPESERLNAPGAPCPECFDTEAPASDCPVCSGTGGILPYRPRPSILELCEIAEL